MRLRTVRAGEGCRPRRGIELERGRLHQRVGGGGVVHAAITNSRGGVCVQREGGSCPNPRQVDLEVGGWLGCRLTAAELEREAGEGVVSPSKARLPRLRPTVAMAPFRACVRLRVAAHGLVCRPACGFARPDSAAPTPLAPFGLALSRMVNSEVRNETWGSIGATV